MAAVDVAVLTRATYRHLGGIRMAGADDGGNGKKAGVSHPLNPDALARQLPSTIDQVTDSGTASPVDTLRRAAQDHEQFSPPASKGVAMSLLLLFSLPFAAIGAWSGRLWTTAVPFLFWLAFAWLEGVDILPGTTSAFAALVAGAIGAVFAGFGIVIHPRLRHRAI